MIADDLNLDENGSQLNINDTSSNASAEQLVEGIHAWLISHSKCVDYLSGPRALA